eukprot:588430-Pelagomonas_calceolata.AAC.1
MSLPQVFPGNAGPHNFLSACTGLDRCNMFTHCVQSGQPIVMREFVVDLRKRLRGAWNAALAEHGEHTNKLAKYHHWMALPSRPLSFHGTPFSVPTRTSPLT